MPIQHAILKLIGKEKLSFIELIEVGTYIRIGLKFSLYSLTKKRQKEQRTEKQIKLQTVKEVMHQSLTQDE